MIELVFQYIALIAYLFCGIRIICFNQAGKQHNCRYAILATILIGAFIGQSIHILFLKDPVTLWDAIFALVLAVSVYRAKGNVARVIWSSS